MPTDLRDDRTLERRPRLKDTCIKLHDLALELGPEAKLPPIAELRNRLGVSVYTLNDAVRELEKRQVLRSVNGVGIYVTPRRRILTGNIGLIASRSLHRHPTNYYSQLTHGIEDTVQQSERHLMVLGNSLRWDVHACEKVDGILVAGIEKVDQVVRQLPPALPVVSLLIGAEKTSSVTADDYQGGQLAVQHLLAKGHRRIACLMEEQPNLPRRRFAGYRDALQKAGIEVEPAWSRLTAPVNAESRPPYIEWGRQQMLLWLHRGWRETGCTAIFVQNELAAIGVMQVLQEEGIEVPQQVSVIGFDGTEVCDYVTPRLCAVQVPLDQIGTRAVEMLIGLIENGPDEPQSVSLPLRIREGASVGPPP